MRHNESNELLLHYANKYQDQLESIKLTQEQLKHHLHYAPNTGVFHWIVPTSKRHKHGQIAGGINPQGIPTIYINKEAYAADKLAYLYMYNILPKHIEHLDGNPCNNIILNLQETSQPPTVSTLRSNNKSGVTGVSWIPARKRWEVRVSWAGVQVRIGQYSTLTEAIQARYDAEVFHNLNTDHTQSPAYIYLTQQLLK